MSDFFGTLWTVTHQTPLSVGFSRQEYWSRLPHPPVPEDLPKPRIEPTSLLSPALAGGFFTTSTPFSRGSSHPGIELGSPALQSDSLPAELPENPNIYIYIEIYFIII